MHTSKCLIHLLSVALALTGGCAHPPWHRSAILEQQDPAPVVPHQSPLAATGSQPAEGALPSEAASTDEAAMLEVLEQIESLGNLDSEARRQLIADLRKTKPSVWPDMAQHFRATLAFSRQLRQRDAENDNAGQPSDQAGPRSAQLVGHDQPVPPGSNVSPAAAGSATPASPMTVATARQSDRVPQPLPLQPAPIVVPSPTPALATPVVDQRSPVSQPPTVAADRLPVSVEPNSGPPPSVDWEEPGKPGQNTADTQPVVGSVADGASASETEDWQGHLAGVIDSLEREARTTPRTEDEVKQQAALRILCLAAGRREEALRPIQGVSPTLQDFWSKQLYGLATYLDSDRQADSSRRATVAKQHLCEAANRLGELGLLTVQNLALCTEVTSFGVYKPFDSLKLSPGQDVLLYAEVSNFKSEPTDKGFRTALRSSYQILDGNGHRVDQRDFSVTEDYCRNRRWDFFMHYRFKLPRQISAGTYTLELTIDDTQANKIGQSSIEFSILDPPTYAGG